MVLQIDVLSVIHYHYSNGGLFVSVRNVLFTCSIQFHFLNGLFLGDFGSFSTLLSAIMQNTYINTCPMDIHARIKDNVATGVLIFYTHQAHMK